MKTHQATHVWLQASSAPVPGGVGAAMILKDDTGRCLGAWRSVTAASSEEHASLIAIVQGLREAREWNAQRVTVLCPFPQLISRLNRLTPTAWKDPVALHWIQARALSHAFVQCRFRTVEAARVSEVTLLARDGVQEAPLAATAAEEDRFAAAA